MEVSINACGNILLLPVFPFSYSLGHDLTQYIWSVL